MTYALLLFFLACNPWRELHEQERVWYDKSRIENELGLELVSLKHGGPLWYNPRLIIHNDRIDFDNRAWFLSLPDAIFVREEETYFSSNTSHIRDKYLREDKSIIPLNNGCIPPKHLQDNLIIPQLHSTLSIQESIHFHTKKEWLYSQSTKLSREEKKTLETFSLNIIVEPQIPMSTLHRILYTSFYTGYSSVQFAGWKDGQVQGVLSRPLESYIHQHRPLEIEHPINCRAFLSPQKGWITCKGMAQPITTNKDCTHPNWVQMMSDLASLSRTCMEIIDTNPIKETSPTLGSSLSLFVTGSVLFEDFVRQMDIAYDHYPDIKQYDYPILSDHWSKTNALHTPDCSAPLHVQTLSDAQKKELCNRFTDIFDETPVDGLPKREGEEFP